MLGGNELVKKKKNEKFSDIYVILAKKKVYTRFPKELMSDFPIYDLWASRNKESRLLINVFLQVFREGVENRNVVNGFTCYVIQKLLCH